LRLLGFVRLRLTLRAPERRLRLLGFVRLRLTARA
jgi:hypothetical protein